MWSLTFERKEELLKKRDDKIAELESLRKKTPKDLWSDDLDVFLAKLEEVEAKELKEMETAGKVCNINKKEGVVIAQLREECCRRILVHS